MKILFTQCKYLIINSEFNPLHCTVFLLISFLIIFGYFKKSIGGTK